MFLLKTTRENLVQLLPEGGVGVEIGVAEGNFAEVLLTRAGRLHLIDPWEHQVDPAYLADPSNVDQAEADHRYATARTRFASASEAGRVVIHRAYSDDVAQDFPDQSLDWVYIDGAHHFEACLADLRNYLPKIKPDGLILGHDYASHSAAKSMGFDVVEAVNQFVRDGAVEMIVLTYEPYPTYVLARTPLAGRAQTFLASALYHFEIAMEIRNPEAKRLSQTMITLSAGTEEVGSKLLMIIE